jgi:L-cysteine:1D-myo-inositol 2-amino-2-deoxy-alpha-D-glucopyranoside ligase
VAPDASPVSAPETTLAGVRARIQDDLDAPGALAVVDRWADALLAAAPTQITSQDVSGARLIKQTAEALLGISL